MKKIWIGVAVALLVVAVGGGAFWAGMSYGKSQASQDVTALMQERFGARGIQLPEGAQVPAPGQFQQRGQGTAVQFAGGIRGTIEAVEGDTLVINSDEGIIRVQTTDTTMIEKNMSVGVGDLEVGEMVVVSGPQNDDGSITARSIMSMRAFQLGQPQGGE
ncbi:MAG: hypothetical protein FJ014_04285 [Chloroflexi bacterium]|nr:hypothetical protein [Chloroflexota bacterium]